MRAAPEDADGALPLADELCIAIAVQVVLWTDRPPAGLRVFKRDTVDPHLQVDRLKEFSDLPLGIRNPAYPQHDRGIRWDGLITAIERDFGGPRRRRCRPWLTAEAIGRHEGEQDNARDDAGPPCQPPAPTALLHPPPPDPQSGR